MPTIEEILVPGQSVNKQELRQYLGSRETPRPEDYGALGNGINDDTAAINQCLTENKVCLLGPKSYRITDRIVLGYGMSLIGYGDMSIIQAQDGPLNEAAVPPYSADFNAVEFVEGYSQAGQCPHCGWWLCHLYGWKSQPLRQKRGRKRHHMGCQNRRDTGWLE